MPPHQSGPPLGLPGSEFLGRLLVCEPQRQWYAAFTTAMKGAVGNALCNTSGNAVGSDSSPARIQLEHTHALPSAATLIATSKPVVVVFDTEAYPPDTVLPWLRGLEAARAVRVLAVSFQPAPPTAGGFDYHAVLREEGVVAIIQSPRDAKRALATVRRLLTAATDWSEAPLQQQIWQRLPWG